MKQKLLTFFVIQFALPQDIPQKQTDSIGRIALERQAGGKTNEERKRKVT